MKPTFIATNARSGSTLLRWLIDAHPEVSCPSETDVAQLLVPAGRSIFALYGDAPGRSLDARNFVEGLVQGHLDEVGKSEWCDKSLSNALNLDLLAKTWLGGRFIFLHRHVMDFIASGLEASPWGLGDYGFAPYAQQSPTDMVGALARYWVDRTTRMLEFEACTGHPTLRLRYEYLVTEPHDAMRLVWRLLGVSDLTAGHARAFEAPHASHGSADHCIWFTDGVDDRSLDKGIRVPPARITGPLRAQVNACLSRLGYAVIHDHWGAGGAQATGGEVRVVFGHRICEAFYLDHPGTIAVDQDAVEGIVSGAINIGAALRSRQIRYYGPDLAGYGEERDLFERLPKILGA